MSWRGIKFGICLMDIACIGYFLFELGDVTNEKIFVDIGFNVADIPLSAFRGRLTLKDI